MSRRTNVAHAVIACDFPDCTRGVPVRLDLRTDDPREDFDRAATKARAEGWTTGADGQTVDFCHRHAPMLDAITDAYVEAAKAEGCTPDRAKLRVVLARSLKTGGAR